GEVAARYGLLADLHPLGERRQVRRRVAAGAQAVALEDPSDEAQGGRLAVRTDHVDRREAPLRHSQRGHQLVHAVEAEAHTEQLEIQPVLLRLLQVHSPPSSSSSASNRASLSRSACTTSAGAFCTNWSFASLPFAR